MSDSADALLAHAVGDYVLQTDHMAVRKTQAHGPAALHALTYGLPFLALTRRWQPLAVIVGTHFVIDRWRLAKRVVWAKNQLAPALWRHPWDEHVSGTGYHQHAAFFSDDACEAQSKPDYMAVWLMVFADNTMHALLNRWALHRWSS